MAGFLEQKNKAGVLAPVFSLLEWRGGLGTVLLIVGLVTAFFLLPATFREGLPGARLVSAVAARLGLLPPRRTLSELLAEARLQAAAARPGKGGSSVDLVRGGAKEMSFLPRSASKLAAGLTVKGILTPKEAERGVSGVRLSREDLSGERAEEAGEGSKAWAYAGKDFFRSPGQAVGGDYLDSALGGTDSPGARGAGQKGATGKISRGAVGGLMAASREALSQTSVPAFKSFSDLTQSQVSGTLSRGPLCTAKNNCPGEFATTYAGAVYDGNPVGLRAPSVLSATSVDGSELPDLRGAHGGSAAANIKEAAKAKKDAELCAQARRRYEPQIRDLNGRIGALSKDMSAMSCSGGEGFLAGLFGSSSRACQAKRAEKSDNCRLLGSLRCAEMAECPLTGAEPCAGDFRCD